MQPLLRPNSIQFASHLLTRAHSQTCVVIKCRGGCNGQEYAKRLGPRLASTKAADRGSSESLVDLGTKGNPSETHKSDAENLTTFSSRSQSASDKLFADALLEEEVKSQPASRSMSRVQRFANETARQHENWTGDEDMKDAVLRMLMDKYKPLRSGEIRTADEKMKQKGAVPEVGNSVGSTAALTGGTSSSSSANTWKLPLYPSTGSWANEPLLPSKPSHNPWETKFSVPWHQEAAIKVGTSQSKQPKVSDAEDGSRKKDRANMKRQLTVGRLTTAREATLDYKLGIKRSPTERGPSSARPNPTSVKGWGGYVEDQIEKARKAGLFNNVKGRGRPLSRTTEEHNPFIAREEFLMNRIIQRNGAAPAWVDLQNDLENSVATFRRIVRDSWTRRAVGTITSTNSHVALKNLTLEDVQAFRDPGWLAKEKAYLEAAVKDVNDTVRRYNGLAPYIVRKGTLTLEFEVKKAYEESAGDILRAIQRETTQLQSGPRGVSDGDGNGGAGQGMKGPVEPSTLGFGAFVRSFFRRVFGLAEKSPR